MGKLGRHSGWRRRTPQIKDNPIVLFHKLCCYTVYKKKFKSLKDSHFVANQRTHAVFAKAWSSLSFTHTHTHTHTQTHTHTHTHVVVPCFMGTFHRHNGFYTVQTVKTSLSLIYKLVSSWGPKNVPTRTRILDIAILVGTFCPHNVGYTRPHTHSHSRVSMFYGDFP